MPTTKLTPTVYFPPRLAGPVPIQVADRKV